MVDSARVAEDLQRLGYRLLVLAEDELAFLEVPKPTDTAGGDETALIRPRLFAVVAHSVGTVLQEWELVAKKIVTGQGQDKGLRFALADADVHAHEVGSIPHALSKGEPRVVDLVEGVDYGYTGDAEPVNSAPRFNILFEAPEWRELRGIFDRGSLFQMPYAFTSVGCAFGMSRPPGKKESSKKLDNAVARDYVGLLMRRATRVAEVAAVWKALPSFSTDDPKQIHAAVQERQQPLADLFKKVKQAKHRNLCAASGAQRAALSSWLASLRHRACDEWAEAVPPPADFSLSLADGDEQDQIPVPLPEGSVMFAAKSGSAMYNLSTAESDVDYSVIFATPTRSLLCDPAQMKHSTSTVSAPMGSDKSGVVEYDIKEFGPFLLELCKGNPRNIELLFLPVEEALCVSPDWSWVREHRHYFLTARCVNQYMGFVGDRLKRAHRLLSEAAPGPLPPETEAGCAKLLYHAYHKLFDLQRIVNYQDPIVRLADDSLQRDFIMKIRNTRPLVGDLDPRTLVQAVEAAIDEVKVVRTKVDAERRASGLPLRPEEVAIGPLVGLFSKVRRLHLRPHSAPPRDMRERSRSSSSLAMAEGDTNPTANVVKDRLVRAETEHDVHVLFAAECSSRNLGTAHAESDHDVVALFVHRTEKYFSMYPVRKAIRCTYQPENGEPEVDIELLEVRHAFELCAQNNPTLVEALSSPHVYRVFLPSREGLPEEPNWLDSARTMLRDGCNRHALAWACWSQSKSNYASYIGTMEDGNVLQKKYVHVIRKVLLCQWLMAEATVNQWPPPLIITDLLHSVVTFGIVGDDPFSVDPMVCTELETLLAPEQLHQLRQRGPRRPVLDGWIQNRQANLKTLLVKHPRGEDPAGEIETAKQAWDTLLVPLAKTAADF